MSLILFTLKLLYGLDGQTEFHFSNYAEVVNDVLKKNMFDITHWLHHIACKRMFMNKYHFPSFHSKNSEVDSDMLLQYTASQNISYDCRATLSREMKDFEEVLTKIRDCQYEISTDVVISTDPKSLANHSRKFETTEKGKIAKIILEENYTTCDIDFLLRPNSYLTFLGNNIQVKNGGANDKLLIKELKTLRSLRNRKDKDQRLIFVEIADRCDDVLSKEQTKEIITNNDSSSFQEYYNTYRKHIFQKNSNYLKRISRCTQPDCRKTINTYEKHYNPFERYWLSVIANIDKINKKEFHDFFQNHTFTFREVFYECSRVIEQSHSDFFKEFQATELYLTYSSHLFGKNSFRPKRVLNNQLNHYVSQTEIHW